MANANPAKKISKNWVSVPEKEKVKVFYTESDGVFTLTTIFEEAVKHCRALKYNEKEKMFTAIVSELPLNPHLKLVLHTVKKPTLGQRTELESLHNRYKLEQEAIQKALETLRKMEDATNKTQEQLIRCLKKNGLNLKSGAPDDRQLLVRGSKAKLHNQQVLKRVFDEEAFFLMAEKEEALKGCLVEQKRHVIDKDKLKELKEKRPDLADKIFNFQIVEALHQYNIGENKSKDYCIHCGAAMSKKAEECKNCGLDQNLE